MDKPKGLDFRDCVFNSVAEVMQADGNAVCLTNDMGAMGLDAIRAQHPERVFNVGIAEQNMMSVAGGLALAGKKVFVYGIIAHVTARCFEQVKLDICVPDLPVTILGVGAGLAYGVDGPTHHGVEDIAILRALGNIQIFNPADGVTASAAVRLAHASGHPAYVRMDKEVLPPLYPATTDFTAGLGVLAEGRHAAIVATGVQSWTALEAARALAAEGVAARVIDVYRLKPLNRQRLGALLGDVEAVVTLEEHVATGGVGTIVAEAMADQGLTARLRRLSLGEGFLLGSASREWAAKTFGLTAADVAQAVRETRAARGRGAQNDSLGPWDTLD